MITTEIRPRGGGHRDDGHEEEILQADSDTKKKVTNNDGYINLKHHKRIQTKRNKYQIIGMDERKRCETILRDGFSRTSCFVIRGMRRRTPCVAHSLTTSIGNNLTHSHNNSDVRLLQPEGKTRSTIT